MKKSFHLLSFFLPYLIGTMILASCTSSQKGFPSRSNQTPATSSQNLQEMIDNASDGSTISIPKARYVLQQGLIVSGKRNLVLDCEPGSQILVDDISEDVIEIAYSEQITLKGAFLRHLNPLKEYDCHGDVVKLRNASRVTIENSELDGCGAIGVAAWESDNLLIKNCRITNNSFNAMYFDQCKEIAIKDNVIEKNANLMQTYRTDGIEMSGNLIRNNGGYWEKAGTPGLVE